MLTCDVIGNMPNPIAHGHFAIGCPLEPSRYLTSFRRYLAQLLLDDDVKSPKNY